MTEEAPEQEEKQYSMDGIIRVDEYTITVDGFSVRADAEQESRLRGMTKEQRYNFLKIMGK